MSHGAGPAGRTGMNRFSVAAGVLVVLAGCGVGRSSTDPIDDALTHSRERDRGPRHGPIFHEAPDVPDAGCGGGYPSYDAGSIWVTPAECPNAVPSDLPTSGGLLFESMAARCPASAPSGGTACAPEGVDCTYGSGQPGCFNREWQCVNHQWVDVVDSDPTAPFNAASCQVATLPAGCPSPYEAFFTTSTEACALPAGTSCDYGRGGGARCVEFSLWCDGARWHRTPEAPWAYCACTR